jgi:hypothetical protein
MRNFGPATFQPNGTTFLPPDLLLIDPQNGSADIRWTAPATGFYNVSGRYQGIDTGGGNHHYLAVRDYDLSPGNRLFDYGPGGQGFGTQAPFSFAGNFSAGETIDFLENYGGAANRSFGLTATITAEGVPEPTAFLLLVMGGLFVGARLLGQRLRRPR